MVLAKSKSAGREVQKHDDYSHFLIGKQFSSE